MHRPGPLLATSLATSLAVSLAIFACDSGKPAMADPKAVAVADVKAVAVADPKVGAGVVVEAAAPKVEAVVVGEAGVALKPIAEVEAALGTKISRVAAQLDLAGLVRLVATGKVTVAAELELLLNAPGGASHRVDVDVDGKLDYLQVVELRAGGLVTFELRAVPSSRQDAALAVGVGSVVLARGEAGGKVVVSAGYAIGTEGGAAFEFAQEVDAELRGEVVTVADAAAGAFVGWTFTAGRPVYVSTHASTADIVLSAEGGVQFKGDATARLAAAQLVALRAALRVEAAIAAPKRVVEVKADAGAKAGAKAGAGGKVEHSAKAEHSAKVEGGGLKVGGSVKVGGGVSIGGGGKAGGGLKIGK